MEKDKYKHRGRFSKNPDYDRWLIVEQDINFFFSKYPHNEEIKLLTKYIICGWRNAAFVRKDLWQFAQGRWLDEKLLGVILDQYSRYPITPIVRDHIEAMGYTPPWSFQRFKHVVLGLYGEPLKKAYPVTSADPRPTKEQREFIMCCLDKLNAGDVDCKLSLKDLTHRRGYYAGHSKNYDKWKRGVTR